MTHPLATLDIAEIRRLAIAAGFDLCGVVPLDGAGELPELDYFAEWIARGHSGEMDYLQSRNEEGELKRAAVRNALPWANSVIVCALNYNSAQPYSTEVSDSARGWISRYAWFGRRSSGAKDDDGIGSKRDNHATDYHDTVLVRLRALESRVIEYCQNNAHAEPPQTRCYVDTGPLIERVYAKYAGMGWIGKNTCIINQELGSWLFLGVIITSLHLADTIENDAQIGSTFLPAPDRCGSCTRCIEACPTDALIEPYKMDARRCIAYLTIEKRGEIPEELRARMGHHIFGCDICQDVCPWNNRVHATGQKEVSTQRPPVTTSDDFQPRANLVHPPLDWIAGMSREEFNQEFRGSPIKRAKYQGLRRNAVIAMGNSGNSQFIPQLERILHDEDTTVAEHARWALQMLRQPLS